MYPDIQRQVIANDVVKNLSVLSRFQLIEWKERNPFMKKLCVAFEGNKEFELLDEGDIREIITFIKANSKNVRFLNVMSRFEPYYDELFIRDVLFNFTEDFFAVRENGHIRLSGSRRCQQAIRFLPMAGCRQEPSYRRVPLRVRIER